MPWPGTGIEIRHGGGRPNARRHTVPIEIDDDVMASLGALYDSGSSSSQISPAAERDDCRLQLQAPVADGPQLGREAKQRNERVDGQAFRLAAVGGDGYVLVMMGEYGLIFVTSVEAFYIFGSNGRLVDVKVRKSTDSL